MSPAGCRASCSLRVLRSCPSCSHSFAGAAETSPGKCREWNLLSCLSSQRGASLIISGLLGISVLLTLIFWTWKQCHGAVLVTLRLSFCFPLYLLLQRKHKENWSRVQGISLNCIHSFKNSPTTKSVPQNLLSFKIVWCWELYVKSSLFTLAHIFLPFQLAPSCSHCLKKISLRFFSLNSGICQRSLELNSKIIIYAEKHEKT